jgi:hypothetical protein
MARSTQKGKVAREIQAEAVRIARSRQRPGQTKEQTKLIARGIQKGIEQYKRQEGEKARALDRRLKKARQQAPRKPETEVQVVEKVVYKQHWLPWVLLILTWVVAAAAGLLLLMR